MEKPYITVEVGDRIKDCDPRQTGTVKTVRTVMTHYVFASYGKNSDRMSKIGRHRIHTNPAKKSGYYLMPKEG